jgi:flagellar FliJ protein
MFKFSFEKLLEYQKQQEDVARRDYNESLDKLEIEKARYQKFFKDQDMARDEQFYLKNRNDGVSVSRLNEIDNFLDGLYKKIENQRSVVINHTQIVEQKQEILHLAAKERKILEKLKDKKFQEYKKALKKAEFKEADELVVTRHRSRE